MQQEEEAVKIAQKEKELLAAREQAERERRERERKERLMRGDNKEGVFFVMASMQCLKF